MSEPASLPAACQSVHKELLEPPCARCVRLGIRELRAPNIGTLWIGLPVADEFAAAELNGVAGRGCVADGTIRGRTGVEGDKLNGLGELITARTEPDGHEIVWATRAPGAEYLMGAGKRRNGLVGCPGVIVSPGGFGVELRGP